MAVAVASKERHGDSQALVDTVNVPLQLFMPLRVLEGRGENELTPVPLPLPVDVTLPYLDLLHAPLPEAVPVEAGELLPPPSSSVDPDTVGLPEPLPLALPPVGVLPPPPPSTPAAAVDDWVAAMGGEGVERGEVVANNPVAVAAPD